MDRDSIMAIIIGQVREVVPDLGPQPIASNDAMADLGINSIERSEIVMNTLEAIGLDLPMVQTHGPRNLGELADLLHAKLNRT